MITAAQDRAKRPVSAVAGPYGHPFHASLVPVPIGAFVCVLALDIASHRAADGTGYARAATVVLGIGLLFAVVAAVFGLMDYAQLPRRTAVNRTATTHMILNLLVVAVLGGSFLARLGNDDGAVPTGLVLLTVVALLVLGVSGWLGGHLAYRYGVRVADERVQSEAYVERDVVPPALAGAGRVDRVPGTNVPADKGTGR
jgi:uncharacterized membrane protein